MSSYRLASSLIITRDSHSEPEIFLVKRNPKLRFMGGYWAFPGGTLMKEDYPVDSHTQDLAFIRCALRELFEETGILLGNIGAGLNEQEKKQIRHELLESSSLDNWLEILNKNTTHDHGISAVCNITTPPFSPVIYQTRFMHIPLPDDEVPDIVKGELVDGRFFKPSDAITAWERGEIHIAPPNLFLLRLMARSDLATFFKQAENETRKLEQGALHPVYFVPGILMAPQKTPTLPPATTTNTLIIGTDKLYVIEPATPEQDEQQQLFAKMDEFINQGKKFEAILLTHYHIDHVGAVNAVSQKYNLPVRAHPLTYERIAAGYIKGESLNEGDRIDLGTSPDGQPDWHLDVIHTPGHAKDHLCYLESRYQAAIIGDMMSTISTILIDPPEGHMRTYLDSLKRMLEYPIKTVFPSHGPVHNDGVALIKKFLEHRQERENKIIAALNKEVQSIDTLVLKAYDDVAESAHEIAQRSLLAGLIKLEEDGVCEGSKQGWRLIN